MLHHSNLMGAIKTCEMQLDFFPVNLNAPEIVNMCVQAQEKIKRKANVEFERAKFARIAKSICHRNGPLGFGSACAYCRFILLLLCHWVQ